MAQREKGLQENHGGYNLALDIKNDDKIWHLAGAVEHNFGLAGQEFERWNLRKLQFPDNSPVDSFILLSGERHCKPTNKAEWPGPSPEPEPLNSKSKAPTISKGYTEKRLKMYKWYIKQSNRRIPDEGLTLLLDQADILSL